MGKKILWFLFVFFAIAIAFYPTVYLYYGKEFGFLHEKNPIVRDNIFWITGFYTHILLGGIALLVGWTQFSKKLRLKNIQLHRQVGKLYVITALISATAGFGMSFFANGGLVSGVGFFLLSILWFYTTLKAYLLVKEGKIAEHEKMMIYSYAICFAAVTLRIWLPILIITFKDFLIAYKIVAYLAWIPNVIVAYFIVKKKTELQKLQ